MPRIARIVIPDLPHHITQRSNRRQDVFLRDEDRTIYLTLLAEKSAQLAVALVGYCLMTNHVHLLATPARETALARAIGTTHLRYTCLLNAREGWQGPLWQNRFFSAPLDCEREEAAADLAMIRAQTSLGRPLGSPAFVQQMEQQTGRRLQFGPAGRPKTKQETPGSSLSKVINEGHE